MPTFGNFDMNSTGTTSIEGAIRCGNFTCLEGGRPANITARINKDTTSTHTVTMAIYNVSTLALVAEAANAVLTTAETRTVILPITTIYSNLEANTAYYLCAWSTATTGTCSIMSTTNAGTSERQLLAAGAWPDPLVPDLPGSVLFDIQCSFALENANGVTVGTGGIGTRFLSRDYPVTEGLVMGTTKLDTKEPALKPENSLLTENEKVGL